MSHLDTLVVYNSETTQGNLALNKRNNVTFIKITLLRTKAEFLHFLDSVVQMKMKKDKLFFPYKNLYILYS